MKFHVNVWNTLYSIYTQFFNHCGLETRRIFIAAHVRLANRERKQTMNGAKTFGEIRQNNVIDTKQRAHTSVVRKVGNTSIIYVKMCMWCTIFVLNFELSLLRDLLVFANFDFFLCSFLLLCASKYWSIHLQLSSRQSLLASIHRFMFQYGICFIYISCIIYTLQENVCVQIVICLTEVCVSNYLSCFFTSAVIRYFLLKFCFLFGYCDCCN